MFLRAFTLIRSVLCQYNKPRWVITSHANSMAFRFSSIIKVKTHATSVHCLNMTSDVKVI